MLNLLGISTGATQEVNVSAVATITAKPAIPIALWSNQCDGSNTVPDVKIKMQHPSQKDDDGGENSCWTTFLDCSSGAPDIKAGFQVAGSCTGSRIDGDLNIGTPICQNRGQVNTVIDTAEKFFDANPGQPCWIIPVIGGGGNCDPTNPTNIVDFAKICPTSIYKNGAHSYIQADVTCNQSLADLDSSLCFSHRLVREPTKGY